MSIHVGNVPLNQWPLFLRCGIMADTSKMKMYLVTLEWPSQKEAIIYL